MHNKINTCHVVRQYHKGGELTSLHEVTVEGRLQAQEHHEWVESATCTTTGHDILLIVHSNRDWVLDYGEFKIYVYLWFHRRLVWEYHIALDSCRRRTHCALDQWIVGARAQTVCQQRGRVIDRVFARRVLGGCISFWTTWRGSWGSPLWLWSRASWRSPEM